MGEAVSCSGPTTSTKRFSWDLALALSSPMIWFRGVESTVKKASPWRRKVRRSNSGCSEAKVPHGTVERSTTGHPSGGIPFPSAERRGLFQSRIAGHSCSTAAWDWRWLSRTPGRHQSPVCVPPSESLRQTSWATDPRSLPRPPLRKTLAPPRRLDRRVSSLPIPRPHATSCSISSAVPGGSVSPGWPSGSSSRSTAWTAPP